MRFPYHKKLFKEVRCVVEGREKEGNAERQFKTKWFDNL